MREIEISSVELVNSLLKISENETVCLLDSCGVSHLGSRFLIAGISPRETLEIKEDSANETLAEAERKIKSEAGACIFTISYDFGLKLENIKPRPKQYQIDSEPDFFLAFFGCLIIHDHHRSKTFITGNQAEFDETEKKLNAFRTAVFRTGIEHKSVVTSNFTRGQYLETIEKIKEFIRRGDTYQTNLTQQIRTRVAEELTPQAIFSRLRKLHPAPFAAFLRREKDFVISASPERFFTVANSKTIKTSPIKGTRPRGRNANEDERLRNELLSSAKDRAENVMIVDLLRNDIGRICDFGSVRVEKLCDLETHPTLFHLVSTVSGRLRRRIQFSDILRAVFPCGSITGAPKIRTMQIIDELETADRGLSMGAIGYMIPDSKFQIPGFHTTADLSVAIRTLVIREKEAIFNVGGGIVIDSDPALEYEETLTKAKALLGAINADFFP